MFTSLLHPYRFPIPYAVAIFDTPFVLAAIGVGYLCLERHRLWQDSRSAFLGTSLWLAGLFGLAHILTQPDYPGTPTIHAGVAPYFFLLSCTVGFAGIGLAAHNGDRQLPLSDRARFWIGVGIFFLFLLVVMAVILLRPLLPSLVMNPGRLTPFAIGVAGVCCGLLGGWALWAGAQKVLGKTQDWFAGYLMLAALIWLLSVIGFLIYPFRYGVTWYMAGLARPIGVGVVFVGLLWEQVWLYQQARARHRDLEVLHNAGQAIATTLDQQALVDTITTQALQVTGAESAILFQLDEHAQILQRVSQAGQNSQKRASAHEPPVETGVAELAVTQRQPVWTSNIQVDDRIQLPSNIKLGVHEHSPKAVMAIPLMTKSEGPYRSLSVSYSAEREFTDTDVDLLSAFGTQVCVAMETVKSFEQLAVKAQCDRTLQTFGQRLLEASSEEAILNEAVRVTRDLLEANYAGLFLFDPKPGQLRLKAGVGWGPGNVGVILVSPSAESSLGYSFVNKECVQVEDFSRECRFSEPPYLAAHGVQAGLLVPLVVRDQPVGVIGAYYQLPHRSSEEDIRLLMNVVDHAELALEKVRLYGELQANLKRLQEAQAQLVQADKLKALGTLLSGMAHELNNPLSSIILSTQLLKQQSTLPDPVGHRVEVIEQQAERASGIIRDLLVFARRSPPDRQRVDLNEAVERVLSLQAPDFDLNVIHVVRDLDPAVPKIWADGHQLQQVFLNLFSNAIHAMKSVRGQRSLTVRSYGHGSDVYLDVDDNGPGIPPNVLGRIFEPFFTTKGLGEGTGLGLTLSFGIIDAHGGKMQAENLPGLGARFTVRLPIGQGEEPVKSVSLDPLIATGRARILVVDDEKDFRKILVEILSSFGHQVEEAATGQEAMTSIGERGYDLVALDLRLPDLDGTGVWRWILSRHPALASRVVFMTGDILSPETETFLQEAGRPVLTKPLTMAQVKRTVDEALREETSCTS